MKPIKETLADLVAPVKGLVVSLTPKFSLIEIIGIGVLVLLAGALLVRCA